MGGVWAVNRPATVHRPARSSVVVVGNQYLLPIETISTLLAEYDGRRGVYGLDFARRPPPGVDEDDPLRELLWMDHASKQTKNQSAASTLLDTRPSVV